MKDNPVAFCDDCYFCIPSADWSEATLCVDCWEVFKPERIKLIIKRKQALVDELMDLLTEERRILQTISAYRICSAWTRHDKGHWVGVPPTAEDQEPVETASSAPAIVKTAPPAEPPARKDKEVFRDVAMYRTSAFMGNVTRQDCKEITVQYGVKYAQYDNAVQVSYLEKGKRKARGFMVDSHPFLVLVPVKEAIEPDSMYGEPMKSESGLTFREGRYRSFDERWTADFMTKLEASGATVTDSEKPTSRDES